MRKPDAYLVANGRLFEDVACTTEAFAEERVAIRKDGSMMKPLFALTDEEREALSEAIAHFKERVADLECYGQDYKAVPLREKDMARIAALEGLLGKD